jgi:type II secretory pathway pseudopilin PulG
LVVILIIAILAALLLPALSKAKNQATITTCLNNEHQQQLALFMYAQENLDMLPDGSSGAWAWDVSVGLKQFMTNNGTTYRTWYDPGIEPRFQDTDFRALWNYVPGSFAVIGYALTLQGTPSYGTYGDWVFSTNTDQKTTMTSVQGPNSVSLTVIPALRPLNACATLCESPQGGIANVDSGMAGLNAAEVGYNWTDVAGGYSVHHEAAHLVLGGTAIIPQGGNVGMLDGHIRWVPFNQMLPRAGGGSPVFFY